MYDRVVHVLGWRKCSSPEMRSILQKGLYYVTTIRLNRRRNCDPSSKCGQFGIFFFRTSFDDKLHGFHFKHIPCLEFLYYLCFYEVVVTFKLNMWYLIRKILTFKPVHLV